MCKYCKFTYVSKTIGERSNEVKRIARVREGHRVLDLNMHRYRTDDGHSLNELILDDQVDLENGLHTVWDKHIEIKYCPFCGEKL